MSSLFVHAKKILPPPGDQSEPDIGRVDLYVVKVVLRQMPPCPFNRELEHVLVKQQRRLLQGVVPSLAQKTMARIVLQAFTCYGPFARQHAKTLASKHGP